MRRFGRWMGPMSIIVLLAGAALTALVPALRGGGWALIVLGGVGAVVSLFLNREELLPILKGRPLRHGATSVFYALVVLAIVVVLNILASRHGRRFDLTSSGLNTLSPQTLQVLQGLDVPVSVVVFQTPDEPRGAQDLLEEYGRHTDKLSVRILDPARHPAEAQAFQIERLPTIIVSTDKGKAPPLTPSSFDPLDEEALTNALLEATSASRPTICVTTGHGEARIDDEQPGGFRLAADAMRRETMEVKELRLLQSDAAGDLKACSTVIVPGPSHLLLAAERDAIEGWLAGGGKLLVLREPRTPTGLEDVLARWGLKANDDVVVDLNPIARLMGGSPEMPVVYEYGNHEIVKDFQGLATVFPTVGSVDVVEPAVAGAKTDVLARSSAESWGERGDLTVPVALDPGTEKAGPLSIAAVSSAPVPGASDPKAADSNASDGLPGKPAREARVVFFGDSDFARNATLMTTGNRDLLLNVLAWLNVREELVSIRARDRKFQPLNLTQQQWVVLLFYGLAMLPLLLLVEAVHVFMKRRRL